MKPRTLLRKLLERQEILVVPGVYNAMTAKIAESVGFEAAYMSGFGTVASLFGYPDIGLITMTEMVENARRIASAVSIPVIADADTGYGNHLNVARTVEEFERAGVAGIHIEDQTFPKRCGHMEGHKVIPDEEMASKIRAAVAARKDRDFIIIARTDAISAIGFEEAIRRANKYLKAGADLIFVEAPTTIEQLEKIPKLVEGPTLINVAPKTPFLHYKDYERMGYRVAIYPPISLLASFVATRERFLELRHTGLIKEGVHGGVPLEEFLEFLGIGKFKSFEEEVLREGKVYSDDH